MIKYLDKKDDLDSIINKGTWLIDFYAEWCGPCRMFSDIAESIDFIDILKIDVDTFPEIAKEFGIMSIPTLLYFKDGEEMYKKIGLQSYEEVKDIVDNKLK